MKMAQEVRLSGHLERTSQRSRTFQMNKCLRGWPIFQDRAPYVQRQEKVSFCSDGPGVEGDGVQMRALNVSPGQLEYVENF